MKLFLVMEKPSRDIKMGQTKRIGIQVKNLYKLEVDGCAAMMGKAEEVVSRDEGARLACGTRQKAYHKS